jgi:hypothetical protein
MLDSLKTSYEKGDERGGRYLDKLGALLEDSFDGVLNFCGLRVITVGCEYRLNDMAHDLTRTKRELWDGR